MRIAAFDLGSNSFHMIVVEARLDGSFVPLVRDKEMLRLGDRVARDRVIGDAADEAVGVVRRFKAIADAEGADEVIAIGTSALREALDGAHFVDRLRDEVGVDVKLVDGVQEARLIFDAVRSSVVIDPAPALAADLGGGSLEIMVGDRSGLTFASSLRLGVGRLTAELVESDPPRRKDLDRLHARLQRELSPVLKEVRAFEPKMLIGSSGTFICLARMAVAMRDGALPESVNQLHVNAGDLAHARAVALEMPSEERAKLPGCDARRAELLPAGFAVLGHLMAESGLEQLTLSEWALREGIVLSAIAAHDRAELDEDPRAIRRASVLSLCRRSGFRQAHARKVAALAGELFDLLAPAQALSPPDRELLELGALLHDIGEHISRGDHDRHTAYLIEHGGLRGFTPSEIAVLTALGRYHMRGNPKSARGRNGLLDPETRRKITALVAILRVADALDATHASLVSSLEGVPGPGHQFELRVTARGDAELEQWMFRRKKELFEKTFGLQLHLEVDHRGRDDYEAADAIGFG